jgi:hypothetical protein
MASFSSADSINFDISSSDIDNAWSGYSIAFEYLGYNPVEFKKVLEGLLRGRTPAEAKQMIAMAVILFITRGNKVKQDKMSEAGKTEVSKLVSVLGLDLTKREPGTTMGPKVVTLARIAGIYPNLIARTIQLKRARIIGDQPMGFPLGLCFAGAAAIMPDTSGYIWKRWSLWRDSFSNVVTKDETKRASARAEAEKYAKVTQATDYIDKSTRIAYCELLFAEEEKVSHNVISTIALEDKVFSERIRTIVSANAKF